jgi:hypothetical protein
MQKYTEKTLVKRLNSFPEALSLLFPNVLIGFGWKSII